MKLALTIDVEEDGLFSGRYEPGDSPSDNVSHLARLTDLFSRLQIRPTLLVTYQVARHAAQRELLRRLTTEWQAEIGAHLHHWNTPPLLPQPLQPSPGSSEQLSPEILAAKLSTLLTAVGQIVPDRPVAAFRMGRFNLGPRMMAVLERFPQIAVDSSILPMRRYPDGPLRLAAPASPYFPDLAAPWQTGSSRILEVPVTVTPIYPAIASACDRFADQFPGGARPAIWLASRLGAWTAQPMDTGPLRLRAAAQAHQRRGGEVLCLYFHSSELMPGGCARHPTASQVQRFLAKLETYLSWLRERLGAEPATLSAIARQYQAPRS